MKMNRPKMFVLFFLIAHGGGLALALLFPDAWHDPSGLQKAVGVLHLLPVLLATLVVQGPILKQPILEPLGLKLRPSRYWLIAWLAPLVVLGVGLGVSATLGHDLILDAASYIARKRASLDPEMLPRFDEMVEQSPPGSPLSFIGPGLLAGVTLNLLLGLATEIGWRGFLFREVQGGFWRRSLLIGLAEATYFAPILALGYFFGDPATGLAAMSLWCVAVSPVLVYLRARSGSVLPVAVFRGTVLALTAVAADLTTAPSAIRPFFGAAGTAGVLVLLLGVIIHDRFCDEKLVFPKEKKKASAPAG
jgi:hypothetical protein